MSYLLSMFAPWLLLTWACGVIIGWVTWDGSGKSRFGGWIPYGAALFAVALALALSHILAAQAALWLESALLFFAAYIIGCCCGAFLQNAMAKPLAEEPGFALADRGEPDSSPPAVEQTIISIGSPPVSRPEKHEPAPAPSLEDEDKHTGRRPPGLVSARSGKPDDLKLISGIGPQNEARLQALGIWHFAQIGAWTKDEIAWVGSYLAFPGRIERENWQAQAKQLSEGKRLKPAARAMSTATTAAPKEDRLLSGDPAKAEKAVRKAKRKS